MKKKFCRHKYNDLLASSTLSNIVIFIIGLSDMLIVGFFYGNDGISSVSLIGPLASIINFTGYLFEYGVRFLFPTESGKKNLTRANHYFSCSMTITIALTLILFFSIDTIGNFYISTLNISDNYMELVQTYFTIQKYVLVISPILSFMNTMVLTDGGTRTSRISTYFYIVANILLSIIFAIYLGIAGIAFGTLIAGLGSLLINCVHFFTKNNTMKFRPYFSLKDTLTIIRYGTEESSFFLLSGFVGFIINTFIINNFGEQYIVVSTVIGYVNSLCLFFGGCQGSMVPILNVYFGEENWDGMKKILKVTFWSSIIMGACLTVIALVLAPFAPIIFSVETEELKQLCIIGTRISSLSYIVTGILGILTRYFNAIGKNLLSTVLSRIKDTGIYLLLFLIFGKYFGIASLWLTNVFTPIVSLPIFIIILLFVGKRDNILSLPSLNTEIMSWDFVNNQKNMTQIRNKAEITLKDRGFDSKAINRVKFLIEEYCMTVVDNNPKKDATMEITIIVDNNKTRIIFRDTGLLDDITAKENATTFRTKSLYSFSSIFDSHDYSKLVGFNRKEYVIYNKNIN